jgi:hypothetical protein
MSAVGGCIKQQSHLSGLFDFTGQLALMFGAGPGYPAGDDLAPVSDKIPQQINIFIIELNILVGAKTTKLFSGGEFFECHA